VCYITTQSGVPSKHAENLSHALSLLHFISCKNDYGVIAVVYFLLWYLTVQEDDDSGVGDRS
jgi:hypothetical protein